MALSILQDTAPKKGLAAVARLAHGGMKETQSDPESANNNNNNTNNNNKHDNHNRAISGFTGLLPGQLFPTLMSPLALHATSLFHHSLGWTPQSTPTMQVKTKSTTPRARSNSSKCKKVEVEENTSAPLSPPTSGSSPQSTASSGQEVSTKESREKVFTCRICYRSFGYKHVLQNHERTHTGEKPFECNQCHKRFTRDHHLKTHIRLHTGEKPYHCEHCDRCFVQVANLRRHLRVHTGERPYACQLCSSKFSDSNQLKAHMLIHKGEKPFACARCGGRFRRRHHLMHHKCQGKDNSENSADTTTPNTVVPVSYKSEDDEDTMHVDEDDDDDEDDIVIEHPHDVKIVVDDDNDADLEIDPNEKETHYEKSHHFSREVKQRERKSRDIRRVVRFPNPIVSPIPALIPEQTEPEDLSLSKRDSSLRSDESPLIRRDNPTHVQGDVLTWPHRHPKFRRHISPPLS